MSHFESHNELKLDEALVGLLFLLGIIFLVVPVVFIYSVKAVPTKYFELPISKRIKTFIVCLIIATLLYTFKLNFMEIVNIKPIQSIPLKISHLLGFVILNVSLFGLLYYSCPLWAKVFSNKENIRKNIY